MSTPPRNRHVRILIIKSEWLSLPQMYLLYSRSRLFVDCFQQHYCCTATNIYLIKSKPSRPCFSCFLTKTPQNLLCWWFTFCSLWHHMLCFRAYCREGQRNAYHFRIHLTIQHLGHGINIVRPKHDKHEKLSFHFSYFVETIGQKEVQLSHQRLSGKMFLLLCLISDTCVVKQAEINHLLNRFGHLCLFLTAQSRTYAGPDPNNDIFLF